MHEDDQRFPMPGCGRIVVQGLEDQVLAICDRRKFDPTGVVRAHSVGRFGSENDPDDNGYEQSKPAHIAFFAARTKTQTNRLDFHGRNVAQRLLQRAAGNPTHREGGEQQTHGYRSFAMQHNAHRFQQRGAE